MWEEWQTLSFVANTFERDSPSAVIGNKLRRLLSEAETSGSESGMESATVSII